MKSCNASKAHPSTTPFLASIQTKTFNSARCVSFLVLSLGIVSLTSDVWSYKIDHLLTKAVCQEHSEVLSRLGFIYADVIEDACVRSALLVLLPSLLVFFLRDYTWVLRCDYLDSTILIVMVFAVLPLPRQGELLLDPS